MKNSTMRWILATDVTNGCRAISRIIQWNFMNFWEKNSFGKQEIRKNPSLQTFFAKWILLGIFLALRKQKNKNKLNTKEKPPKRW